MPLPQSPPPHREGCPCPKDQQFHLPTYRCYPCRLDGEILPYRVWAAMNELYGGTKWSAESLLEILQRLVKQPTRFAEGQEHWHGLAALEEWVTGGEFAAADLVRAVRHYEAHYDEDTGDECEVAYDEPHCLKRPTPLCSHVECHRQANRDVREMTAEQYADALKDAASL
jgi:hypothetical protein